MHRFPARSNISRRLLLRSSAAGLAGLAGARFGLTDPRPVRAATKQWYKAELHMHSCVSSEAIADLGIMAAKAEANGYNAIFVTDHNYASSFTINNVNANHMAFLDSYARWDMGTLGSPSNVVNQLVSSPVYEGTAALQIGSSSNAYCEVFATTRRGPNLRSGDVTIDFAVRPTALDEGCGLYVSVAFGADPTVETVIGFTGADGNVYLNRSTVLVWQIGNARVDATSNPNARVYVNSLPAAPLDEWTTYHINVTDAVNALPPDARPLSYVGLTNIKIAAGSRSGGRAEGYIDSFHIQCAAPKTPAEEFVHRNTRIHDYDTANFKLFPSIELGQTRHANRFAFDIQNVNGWTGYSDGIAGIPETQAAGYPAQLNHPGFPGGVSEAEAISNLAYGAELMEIRQEPWRNVWNQLLDLGRQIIGTGSSDTHAGSVGGSAAASRIYAESLSFDAFMRSLYEGTVVAAINNFTGNMAYYLQDEAPEPMAARYPVWASPGTNVNFKLAIDGGLAAGDSIRWIRNSTVIKETPIASGGSFTDTAQVAVQSDFRWLRAELLRSGSTLLAASQPIFLRPVSGMPAGWRVVVDGVDTPNGRGYTRTAVQGITAADWFSTNQVLGMTAENTTGSTLRMHVRSDEPMQVQFEGSNVTKATSLSQFNNGTGTSWWYDSANGIVLLRLVHTQQVSPIALYFASGEDQTPPTAPGNFVATTPGGPLVKLSWNASTDDIGVTAYLIERNGQVVKTVAGNVLNWDDTTVELDTTYTYRVFARDGANKLSPPSEQRTVTTPDFEIVFADDFESGNMDKWNVNNGIVVQQQYKASGSRAARGTSSGEAVHALHFLSSARSELFWKMRFMKLSQSASPTYLLRFRTTASAALLGVFVSSSGRLGVRNDTMGISTTDTQTSIAAGTWHEIQVRLRTGDDSRLDVWLDGVFRGVLSGAESFGTLPIGRLELGHANPGPSFDYVFDDVQVSTAFIPHTLALDVPDVFVCDGDVDGSDTLAVLRQLSGMNGNPQPSGLCSGDVNGDGEITIADAIDVRRYIAGLD